MNRFQTVLTSAIFIASTSLSATADVLTPQEALNRINASAASPSSTSGSAAAKVRSRLSSAPAMTLTSAANEPQLYVFTPAQGAGFMVLSADSDAEPMLGYSDSETFSAENLPDGLRYMLSYYAAEIDRLRDGGAARQSAATLSKVRPEREAIAPICHTKWNQDAPYSNLCPELNGTHCPTGCVATALAQVLKTYEYPAKCTGGTYTYKWTSGNMNLSLNYNTVTLDWENMLDTYDSTATDEQRTAVATLMKAVGYGVEMQYTASESGTHCYFVPTALLRNFRFDKTAHVESREWYTLIDWENMIYEVLAQGHGVYYDGVSNDDYGHAFVIDGYKSDGYFHVNWGWGGLSDGYFLLSALDPSEQGIGGSTQGYDFSQHIVVDLNTNSSTSAANVPLLFATYDNTYGSTSVKAGGVLTVKGGFYNVGALEATGQMALKFVDTTTGETQYFAAGTTFTKLGVLYGYTQVNLRFPSALADGTYLMTPAVATSDGSKFFDVKYDLCDNTVAKLVTVSNATATISDYAPDSYPVFSDVTVTSDVVAPGFDLTLTATASNPTDTYYYGNVCAALFSSAESTTPVTLGSNKPLDLAAGESTEFNYITTLPSDLAPGEYYLAMTELNNNRIVSPRMPLTVGEIPEAGVLKTTMLKLTSTLRGQIEGTTKVTCTSGYYNNVIYWGVFPAEGGQSLAIFTTPKISLNTGQSKTITLSGTYPDGVAGTKYGVASFYVKDSTVQMYVNTFTLTDYSLRVLDVETVSDRAEALKFNVDLTNTGADYNGRVYLQLYQDSKQVATLVSDVVSVKAGKTASVTIEGEFAEGISGETYTVRPYYVDSTDVMQVAGADTTFVLINDRSAINEVSVDSADDGAYFDLMGRRVAPSRPGIYIHQGKKVRL
jgi:hypothetical protein